MPPPRAALLHRRLPRSDMRLLYETMQGPRQCSEREREKLLVALARAEVALQAARDSQRRAEQQVGVAARRWLRQAQS